MDFRETHAEINELKNRARDEENQDEYVAKAIYRVGAVLAGILWDIVEEMRSPS